MQKRTKNKDLLKLDQSVMSDAETGSKLSDYMGK